MRPGQTTINELEQAVLQQLAAQAPELAQVIGKLHVLSREYTGVGCYTNFAPLDEPISALDNRHIGLPGVIVLPDVPNGIYVELSCSNGKPEFLEFVTSGNDRWDGNYNGFSLDGAA